MNKALIATTFFIISSVSWAEFHIQALHCGPRGSFLGALGSDLLIPDYFPPEQFVSRLFAESILGDLSMCQEDYDAVYFGQSCMLHDQCYYTLGATKDGCDEALERGWKDSCAERYSGNGSNAAYCLNVCNEAAQFMYDALRYDNGSWCPAVAAFHKDQEVARERASLKLGR